MGCGFNLSMIQVEVCQQCLFEIVLVLFQSQHDSSRRAEWFLVSMWFFPCFNLSMIQVEGTCWWHCRQPQQCFNLSMIQVEVQKVKAKYYKDQCFNLSMIQVEADWSNSYSARKQRFQSQHDSSRRKQVKVGKDENGSFNLSMIQVEATFLIFGRC